MKVALILYVISAVTSLEYDAYADRAYSKIRVLDSSTDDASFDDLTVTVLTTLDEFRTVTDTFYNSVPVTLTEFIKSTVTVPTLQVVRTPVNDIVRVSTVEVTRPTTETLTDIVSRFKCSTDVSTEYYTITHLDKNIIQTTVTSTIVLTHQFHPTIVQTVIETERQTETETIIVTDTIWVGRSSVKPHTYY